MRVTQWRAMEWIMVTSISGALAMIADAIF
jgi:hypothetical protein